MVTIVNLQIAFIMLIRAGVAMRCSYCFFKMIQNDEETGLYKKRFFNTLGFYLLAESAWQFRLIAEHYYG